MNGLEAFIQYGVIYSEDGRHELFDTREEAEQARTTLNGQLPLIQNITIILDPGDYKEPTDG